MDHAKHYRKEVDNKEKQTSYRAGVHVTMVNIQRLSLAGFTSLASSNTLHAKPLPVSKTTGYTGTGNYR